MCDIQQDCVDLVVDVLSSKQIPIITDCTILGQLLYTEALAMAKDGVLAVSEPCVDENYDPSVTCYGFQERIKYQCYDDENSYIPVSQLNTYMQAFTTKKTHVQQLWMAQGHWQSSEVSVPLGLLQNSSVTKDEYRSKQNKRLAQQIIDSEIGPYINILELDNVCDNGILVFNELQKL